MLVRCTLPSYGLVLLGDSPGVHVVPAPLLGSQSLIESQLPPNPHLGQLLRDHGVDALFEAAVVLPQRLDVDHRVDNSALVHLVDRDQNLCFFKNSLFTFLIAAIFWFSAKFPTASTPCQEKRG